MLRIFFSKERQLYPLWSSRQSSKWLLWNKDTTMWCPNLSAEGMKVKYNIDYLTKCSSFKRALFCQVFCVYKNLVIYFKICITNTIHNHLSHIPYRNHQIEATGQQSSQNCTTPTCIIMQKSIKCICTCRAISPTHGKNLSQSLHQ